MVAVVGWSAASNENVGAVQLLLICFTGPTRVTKTTFQLFQDHFSTKIYIMAQISSNWTAPTFSFDAADHPTAATMCCVLMLMVLKCVDCDGFSLVLVELVIVVTFVVVLHLLLDLGAVD